MGLGKSKDNRIKITDHEFSFDTKDGEYLDVKVHGEGYLELSIETSEKFTITTEEELDLIFFKLKQVLKDLKQANGK